MRQTSVGHSMIGQILQSFGRITERDVEAALEHQKEKGGYFGEALLALGFVTREELDWGLASQFDIPYVFPDASSVDSETAKLVTPEWAMRHLTLPVVRTSDTLHVVVDSPTWSEALEELEGKTGLKVELGLASSTKIRDLIQEVFEEGTAPVPVTAMEPATVEDLVAVALSTRATRLGISVRRGLTTGWYETQKGRIDRMPMTSDSRKSLDTLLVPTAPERPSSGAHEWVGRLSAGDELVDVDVTYLAAQNGEEFVFRVDREALRITAPDRSIVSELRLLVSSGVNEFLFSAADPAVAQRLHHRLPELVLEGVVRAVAVTDEPLHDADDLFVQVLPQPGPARERALASLRDFRFDAATVALADEPSTWWEGACAAARTVFVLATNARQREYAVQRGVAWELRVKVAADGLLDWTLDSPQV